MQNQTTGAILTFKRYEKKYLLSEESYRAFMNAASDHLQPDRFHKSLVCSVYYDHGNFELIRRSIERPVYKEKIRLRSYGVPDGNGTAFVELKKKYKGIVYKRRAEMTAKQAEDWLNGRSGPPEDNQTTREICYFLKMNPVEPKVFIGADRTAYVDRDNPELRFTIDSSIRWRKNDLSLTSGDHGEDLLDGGDVLMEIKIPEAAPVWLARLLSNERIFPTSFSKYGTIYKSELERNHPLC